MFQIPGSYLLTASIIAAVVGITSLILGPATDTRTEIRIEPQSGVLAIGDQFTIEIIVESEIPVNVFKGVLLFDQTVLAVESIEYNTSIADLWAEEPWYSNGDGTLNFIGGTTRPGGFTGTDTLLEVTFKARASGVAELHMSDIQILQHDGLGTEAPLQEPIDSLFTVQGEDATPTIPKTKTAGPRITVLSEIPDTDLNDDGVISIIDSSIFMVDLATGNLKPDFNSDGSVDLTDLSILHQ